MIGGYEPKVMDPKHRVVVPKAMYPKLVELCDPPDEKGFHTLIVAIGPSRAIGIFPPKVYDEMIRELERAAEHAPTPELQEKALDHLDEALSTRDELKMDGTLHRVPIPSLLAQTTGILPFDATGRADSAAAGDSDSSEAGEQKSGKPNSAQKQESAAQGVRVVVVGKTRHVEVLSMNQWMAKYQKTGASDPRMLTRASSALREFV